MEMGHMLEASDLSLPGRLHRISVALEPGTITAICGPNGAGKSTLLTAMAGLLRPAQGQVALNGQQLLNMAPRARARAIGFLPQMGEVAWDVSVRSLAMLGRMSHGDDAAIPVEAALRMVGMSHLADRPVSTLSGGERARALLARVLAGQPEWILADEPLAALDLGHQLALMRHLRGAAEQGAGVVLVMHDLALAMNHADRVLLLDGGRMVADGPPRHALSEPRIRSVWGIEGRWIGGPDGWALAVRGAAGIAAVQGAADGASG